MLNKRDLRDDDLLLCFDDLTKAIRKQAKKYNVDLSKILIRNKECEKYHKRYIFYN